MVLVAVYGAGHGVLRARPSTRSCRTCCPSDELAQANALDQLVRPIALRLAGPALGGWLVAALGVGRGVRARRGLVRRVRGGRACDAAGRRPAPRAATRSVAAEHAPGLRASCAATSGSGAPLSAPRSPTSASWGRPRCCCPTWSRTTWAAAPAELGLVFAAGGLGSVAARSSMGRRGLPRRNITFMYVVWTLATLAVAGYGLATAGLAADARQRRCSTRSRRPARSSGRRRSSATSRPRCWAACRASTG